MDEDDDEDGRLDGDEIDECQLWQMKDVPEERTVRRQNENSKWKLFHLFLLFPRNDETYLSIVNYGREFIIYMKKRILAWGFLNVV